MKLRDDEMGRSRRPWPLDIEIGENPRAVRRDWRIRVARPSAGSIDELKRRLSGRGTEVSSIGERDLTLSLVTVYDEGYSPLSEMVALQDALQAVDESMGIIEINESPRENWDLFLGPTSDTE